MATSKLNAEQFDNLAKNAKGVILVYAGKDGANTAQHFYGADYEAKDNTEDEVFRVWKNVVQTFWAVKAEELRLREHNDGIRSKLRATTPIQVVFNDTKGETVKKFDLDESVWAKVGLVPTKIDLERTAKDYKKAIFKATKASFDALGFRVEMQKVEKKAKEEIKAEAKVNPQPAQNQKQVVAAA